MPERIISGVRPRVIDARAYEGDLRSLVLNPLMDGLRVRLGLSQTPQAALTALAEEPFQPPLVRLRGGVQGRIERLEDYHRRRTIQTFLAGARINVSRVLTQPAISQFLDQVVDENVRLIRTIPRRVHADLSRNLRTALDDQPFNQQLVRRVIEQTERTARSNVRLITRDQTSKTIGRLSEIRNRQIGIERYRWRTSQDERVRDSHRVNGGREFRWSQPPLDTGHPGADIQCRCVAQPIFETQS